MQDSHMHHQWQSACVWQATGLNKLDGPGADKEAVSQQLAAVQQQVEQVGGENDELRTFFQEALQVKHSLVMALGGL